MRVRQEDVDTFCNWPSTTSLWPVTPGTLAAPVSIPSLMLPVWGGTREAKTADGSAGGLVCGGSR